MKFFIPAILFTLVSLNCAYSFVPQALVDIADLSKHIVGPPKIKDQGNDFIKGFFFGSLNRLQIKYVPSSAIETDQKGFFYFLVASIPQVLASIDMVKNYKSLCLASRITGIFAGHLATVKLTKMLKL